MSIAGRLGAASLALLLAAPAAAQEDEAAQIREASRQWAEAATAGDVDGLMVFYADDVQLLAPNAPTMTGQEAVRAFWTDFLALENAEASAGPDTAEVAESGELGYIVGRYSFAFDGEGGRVEDQGKYVEIWKKIDDAWRIAVDIFNSDLPME